jgi:[ribosomal protein S5]-alanine N-acetyltransferase
VRLELTRSVVRDFRPSDAASLVEHANNRKIWLNLRDRFPSPYTEADARSFFERLSQLSLPTVWAIEVDSQAVGGIGLELLSDVERVSAELGYWLGERYWNRGIVTEAVREVTAEAFRRLDLTRIFALPFADNIGSIRVLEKAGFVLEGTLRQSAIKDGTIRDQRLYAAYRKEGRSGG